jgi:predicted nuclease of restriction endonuclease-like (RecB) superfamily
VTKSEIVLPPGYPELLEDLKSAVAAARWRAQRVVNTELLGLYWRIGHTILDRQQDEGWGTRVIDRLSTDLRAAYPEMRGLSQRNLVYMRSFAAAFPTAVAQQPVLSTR